MGLARFLKAASGALAAQEDRWPLWLPVVLASAAASILAYKTIGSPWHVTVGAFVGVVFAALMPSSGKRESQP